MFLCIEKSHVFFEYMAINSLCFQTGYYAFKSKNSIIEVTRNPIAANAVYLLNIALIVRPLFLPKNVSAPPAIEPLSPADLPDCNNTISIIERANII